MLTWRYPALNASRQHRSVSSAGLMWVSKWGSKVAVSDVLEGCVRFVDLLMPIDVNKMSMISKSDMILLLQIQVWESHNHWQAWLYAASWTSFSWDQLGSLLLCAGLRRERWKWEDTDQLWCFITIALAPDAGFNPLIPLTPMSYAVVASLKGFSCSSLVGAQSGKTAFGNTESCLPEPWEQPVDATPSW